MVMFPVEDAEFPLALITIADPLLAPLLLIVVVPLLPPKVRLFAEFPTVNVAPVVSPEFVNITGVLLPKDN